MQNTCVYFVDMFVDEAKGPVECLFGRDSSWLRYAEVDQESFLLYGKGSFEARSAIIIKCAWHLTPTKWVILVVREKINIVLVEVI